MYVSLEKINAPLDNVFFNNLLYEKWGMVLFKQIDDRFLRRTRQKIGR